jgi:hypothetical protein
MNVWDTHRWIGSSSGRSVKIEDKLHQHLFCVTCGRNFITDPVSGETVRSLCWRIAILSAGRRSY